MTLIVIVMGVSGSGKTTVGRRLAQDLGWPFYDGDEFHPPGNIAKMARGTTLSDQDRRPWLEALNELIHRLVDQKQDAVVACSALKHSYRKQLSDNHGGVVFVYLKGNYDRIRQRIIERQDHFMKADLLREQFAVLEEPEEAIVVDIDQDPAAIVKTIRTRLLDSTP